MITARTASRAALTCFGSPVIRMVTGSAVERSMSISAPVMNFSSLIFDPLGPMTALIHFRAHLISHSVAVASRSVNAPPKQHENKPPIGSCFGAHGAGASETCRHAKR